ALSNLATTTLDEPVRRAICQSLTLLLDAYPDEMEQMLPSALGYCLQSLGDPGLSEAVRLEACEFWHSLAERDQAVSQVGTPGVLRQLIPVLLQAVRYSDDDPALLDNDEERDDAAVPDAPSSIRPRRHRAAAHEEDYDVVNDGEDDPSSDSDDND